MITLITGLLAGVVGGYFLHDKIKELIDKAQ